MAICPYCNGTGKVKAPKSSDFDAEPDYHIIVCPFCRGKGEDPSITYIVNIYCDLCVLEKQTRWYTERNEDNGYWTIVECKKCHLPMAVYKFHTTKVPPLHFKALYDLINNHQELWVYRLWRCQMKRITDHFHIHLHKL